MAGFDILAKVFGGGVLTDAVGAGINRLVDLIPDKEKAAEAQRNLEASIFAAGVKSQEDQRDINKIEAANPSMFVAGWRPGLGWMCVTAMSLYYLPKFALGALFWSIDVIHIGHLIPYPDLGIADIGGLIATLLGMGTLRTVEHLAGKATVAIGNGNGNGQ
jgi:hypothetical protein